MKLRIFFVKHLRIITIVFPLLVIFFYGVTVSLALKYKHKKYTRQELGIYEQELKNKHKRFLREKAKYIELFMEFIYTHELENKGTLSTDDILVFIDSLKKYDSGFIFIFDEKGSLIKHPCAETLSTLVDSTFDKNQKKEDTLLYRLLNASKEKKFVTYQGTDCIEDSFVDKVAFVHHIKTTDLYIVISKNEKDIFYSVERKKRVLQKKLDVESNENIKLLIIVSLISIIFSLLFSKFLNTLIKDYEKEIKDSNKAMFSQSRLAQAGELLSMISHQWRQPISKIASITSNLRFQLMMGKEIDSSSLDAKFSEIEDHTEFLSETIDDFREFYKPKKSKESIFVLPLIDKSLSFLEGQIRKKNIVIKKDLDKDVKVSLYKNELIQVIINIVQNAIEFSKDKAIIEIKTKLKQDEYIIFIKDEAGGIKEENLPKIFDAHFSTKVAKGSTNLGLGLYVSKVIIEKHFNGKLDAISEGDSTTFTIRLIR